MPVRPESLWMCYSCVCNRRTEMAMFMPQKDTDIIPYGYVYKVTFPNGKIYVGRDTALNAEHDYYRYFGSPTGKAREAMHQEIGSLLDNDRRLTVTKEVLYAARNCTVGHIKSKEREWIISTGSRSRDVGYNS